MTLSSYTVPVMGGGLLMAICFTLGRLGFSIVWVAIFVALNVVKTKLWKDRERRVIALQHAALKEKEVVLAQLKDLPAWVQFPDTERVEWMNKVIFQLWPYIGEYTRKFIKDIVEPSVKAHLPGPFKSFRFEKIDMGDIPLRVSGIKVYTENVGRDRIVMDMDVAYAGDCEFVISVGMFLAGLRQMQFKGKLRAVLKPLLPKPPMIGGVSVYFLDEPTIDFDLTGLGEFVELPGLIGAVRSVVKTQVAGICVLPNEIVVPLTAETDVVKLYFPEPDGIVRIHIREARNLENKDSLLRGKSDPYVRLSVGAQNYKTKTIDNNLNPQWDEIFEAVVDQANGQKLLLETFDEDPGSKDEILGRLSMDLNLVRQKGTFEEWYPLEGVKHGEIHLGLYWLQLSKDVSLMGNEEQWVQEFSSKTTKNTNLSDAVLLVYMDNISNLPSAKRDIEPSPYVNLSVGNNVQKTFTRPKTVNPLYQQKFVFFVSHVEHQILKVEAIDGAYQDRPLGDISIPIRNILKERNLELYQQTFHLALGPHLAPAVMTVRLRFLQLAEEGKAGAKVDSNNVDAKKDALKNNNNYLASHPNMNPTVVNLLNSENGKSDGKGAWRNAGFSSGAETVHSKRTVGIVQRAQRSNLLSFGKLNKRRSLSAHFDGYLGKILLTIRYEAERKKLSITIHSAEQLHPVNFDGVADPYVSVKLLKVGLLVTKKKTSIYSNTLNPIINEMLEFELHPSDVPLSSISLDVKDSCNYGWFKRPPIIGHVLYDLSKIKVTDEAFTEWFTLGPPINTLGSSLASGPVSASQR